MPAENIDMVMFAPCGMNCKACYKHCYHKKPCAGCLNSDKGKPEHCRKCKIKDCIKDKGLSYCVQNAAALFQFMTGNAASVKKRWMMKRLVYRV